jgi:choline monooxygenase
MNLEQFVPLSASQTRITYRYYSKDGTLDEEVSRISKLLLAEDAAICEAVQRNLDTGVYQRGVLSAKHEQGVALFQRLISEATT